jgi:hypothetical protein
MLDNVDDFWYIGDTVVRGNMKPKVYTAVKIWIVVL